MNREEHQDLADSREANRKKRPAKIQPAKSHSDKSRGTETSGLAIGMGPGICTVAIDGAILQCRCDLSAVPGDAVSIRHGKIAAIATRRTTLSRTDPGNRNHERVIAANVEVLVIVSAIEDPPFSPGLIDRYLIAALRGGIQPVLCINKVDLCSDTAIANPWREMEIPVVLCSTRTGAGIGDLRDLIAGRLAVLAGHSGVGKSSLLNALADEQRARAGAISEYTGKGRQTTTSARLYELRNGARIIDTPGIRELGLGRVTPAELRFAFRDFDAFPCRFRDCTHRDEPECGVRAATGSGAIAKARYNSYLRILSGIT